MDNLCKNNTLLAPFVTSTLYLPPNNDEDEGEFVLDDGEIPLLSFALLLLLSLLSLLSLLLALLLAFEPEEDEELRNALVARVLLCLCCRFEDYLVWLMCFNPPYNNTMEKMALRTRNQPFSVCVQLTVRVCEALVARSFCSRGEEGELLFVCF